MEYDNDSTITDIFLTPTKAPRNLSSTAETALANNKVFDPDQMKWVDKEDKYGFTDSFSAFRQEGGSIVSTMYRDSQVDDTYDPNFRFTDEVIEEYFKPLPEEFHDYMFESESISDLEQRLEQVKITQRNSEILAENMGDSTFTTILAMLGAGVINEENAALMAIPVLGQAAAGVKSVASVGRGINTMTNAMRVAAQGKTRFGTMARTGGLVAGQAGLEGIYASQVLPDYHAHDVMADVGFSGLFGGVLGFPLHSFNKHMGILKEHDVQSARAAGGKPVVPDNRDSLNAPEANILAKSIDEIDSPEEAKVVFGFVNKFMSQGATLRASKNPIVRNFSRILVQDNRVSNTGGANIQATSSIQTMISRSARTKYARVMNPAYNKWVKTQNYGVHRIKARADFDEMVTKAVRSDDAYSKSPKEIQEAADKARQVFADLLEQKKRYRVIGANDVEYNKNYVPTEWDSPKLREAFKNHGKAKVAKIVGQAIARQNGWNLAFSTRISNVFLDKVSGLDTGIFGTNLEDIFEDMTEMRKFLKDNGMSDAEIDEGMGVALKKKKAEKTPDVNMRSRLDMDYETVFEADGLNMSVSELLNNNMTDLIQTYSFKSGRHIGLARNGIGGEGMDTFEEAIKKVEAEGERLGIDATVTQKEVEHIRSLMEGIKGTQLLSDTSIGIGKKNTLIAQHMRNLTYLAYSGYFGFMSLIETANIIGYGGLANVLRVVPQHRDWLRAARNGEIPNEEMQDLIDALGVGTHGMTGSASTRIDEIGGMAEHFDPVMQRARQVQGVISFLTPITDALQRLNLAVMRRKWIAGDLPTAMLRDTGIDDAMYKRIQAQIAKYSDGKRVLNFKDWDDVEATDRFLNSVSIEIRNNIQETDIGATNHFLRNQVGSTLGQFLSFVTASQEQQFARLQRRAVSGMGKETAYVVMGQMLMATLITTARTYNTGMGRSDEAEYIRDNLSTESLVLSGLGYTGAFGLMGMLTQVPDKIQRGWGSGFISNPVVGYFDTVSAIANGAFDEGGLTEAEYRSLFHAIPFLTQVYTKTALNEIAKELGD